MTVAAMEAEAEVGVGAAAHSEPEVVPGVDHSAFSFSTVREFNWFRMISRAAMEAQEERVVMVAKADRQELAGWVQVLALQRWEQEGTGVLAAMEVMEEVEVVLQVEPLMRCIVRAQLLFYLDQIF